MENDGEKRAEEIALFRYGVIGDLVHLPRGRGSGLYERLEEKAEHLLSVFKWGPHFIELNCELLDGYAQAKNSAEVVELQKGFIR